MANSAYHAESDYALATLRGREAGGVAAGHDGQSQSGDRGGAGAATEGGRDHADRHRARARRGSTLREQARARRAAARRGRLPPLLPRDRNRSRRSLARDQVAVGILGSSFTTESDILVPSTMSDRLLTQEHVVRVPTERFASRA